MEILAAHAAAAGLAAKRVEEVLQCVSCDDAIRILSEAGRAEETLRRLMERILFHIQARAGDGMEMEAITFSKVYGQLGRTAGAGKMIDNLHA